MAEVRRTADYSRFETDLRADPHGQVALIFGSLRVYGLGGLANKLRLYRLSNEYR